MVADKHLDEAKRLMALDDDAIRAEALAGELRAGEMLKIAAEQLAAGDDEMLNFFRRGSDASPALPRGQEVVPQRLDT